MFFLLVGAQRMNIHLQNRFYVRQDSSFRIPFPGHRHGSALGSSWKSSFKPSKYDERMYLWYFFSTPACIYIYIPIPVAKQNKPAMIHSTCVAVQGLPMLLHDFHLAQVCPEVPQLDEGAFFFRKRHYWPCGHHTLQRNILVLMGC